MEFWKEKKDQLLKIDSPSYIYDESTISNQVEKLKILKDTVSKFYYAIKANSNLEIVKCILKQGFGKNFKLNLGLECVSIDEVHFVISNTNVKPENILFTPNFAPIKEYEEALKLGVHVTLDNLYLLQQFGNVFKNKKVFIRIDPGAEGLGHHEKVQTSGTRAKFGIHISDLEELKKITKDLNVEIVGIHCHVGSGIFDSKVWSKNAETLYKVAIEFDSVKYLDLGGGLGVPYKPTEKELDMKNVAENLNSEISKFTKKYEIWMEPGRFLVANSGILLSRVTQLKEKTKEHHYVGLDCGMNALIRPTLYNAYHEIINLTKMDETEMIECDIVGPICESGDYLGKSRKVPKNTNYDDVFVILTAGAYGYAMSSDYNLRKKPKEIFLKKE